MTRPQRPLDSAGWIWIVVSVSFALLWIVGILL
jgi:hypothetical protein